jgi:hypothetical protein
MSRALTRMPRYPPQPCAPVARRPSDTSVISPDTAHAASHDFLPPVLCRRCDNGAARGHLWHVRFGSSASAEPQVSGSRTVASRVDGSRSHAGGPRDVADGTATRGISGSSHVFN